MFRKLGRLLNPIQANIQSNNRQYSAFFTKKGGCNNNEKVFKKFQSAIEDEVSNIEKLLPNSGPAFLLQVLLNSLKIGVKDKFFYDAILGRLSEQMGKINDSSQLALLGLSLNINLDIQKDNKDFLLKFYEHVYNHRFVLNHEDKQELSRIFNEMGMPQLYKKHLDLYSEIKGKELAKQACKAFEIEVPDNILMDFDFENRVVIMKNRKTQQMIIIFGSEHHCEQSIQFGKQLIDTFKPQTLLIEDTPLEVQDENDDSIIKKMIQLKGQDFSSFIEGSIIRNKEYYSVDERNKIVYQNDFQGLPMKIPSDLQSYAYYHYLKSQKMDSPSLVLCDLTQQERSTSFILSMSEQKRQQLKKELKYLVLLDTAQWLSSVYRLGCLQCASFLNRSKVQQYPLRPIQLISEEQIPSFADREKCIAHNILRTAFTHNKETNFVAFVGQSHLYKVAKYMTEFLNKGEDFIQYKRPVSTIDDPRIENDINYKRELLKRHAIGAAIYDEGGEGQSPPPFKHNSDDLLFQKAYEIKYLQKIVMAEKFRDIEDFGIKFNKDDFMADKLNPEQQELLKEEKYLQEYLKSKGGKFKCLPLSYLQGNYAYYYSRRNEFIDECDQKENTKNLSKILDYSSGEDEDVKE